MILHDPTLDRTTNGRGAVSAMSLAQLKRLRLLANMGGRGATATEATIPTLDEMLDAARGRLLLNLDVKDAIYAQVVAAVKRAGMQDQVVIKSVVGPGTPPLAAIPPYDALPMAVILLNAGGDADLAAIARPQVTGARPVAIELPEMAPGQLADVAATARAAGTRLWVNTLWSGFIIGWGGDVDALRDPDAVWGRMARAGITIFQTDEPEAFIVWRSGCHADCSRADAHEGSDR